VTFETELIAVIVALIYSSFFLNNSNNNLKGFWDLLCTFGWVKQIGQLSPRRTAPRHRQSCLQSRSCRTHSGIWTRSTANGWFCAWSIRLVVPRLKETPSRASRVYDCFWSGHFECSGSAFWPGVCPGWRLRPLLACY